MRVLTTMLFLLLAVSRVRAQDADCPECREIPWATGSDTTTTVPSPVHMDVSKPSNAPKLIGGSLLMTGGLAAVGSFVFYISRQNYRLLERRELTLDDVRHWETMGAWSAWLAVGGSAALTATEYLLLPESRSIPLLAWVGGVAGVAVAAVGVGFLIGGTHCGPLMYSPGVAVDRACFSGTADAMLPGLLFAASVPLLNLPVVYALRDLFHATDSLTLGPGNVNYRMSF